jgi:hypothetical protein
MYGNHRNKSARIHKRFLQKHVSLLGPSAGLQCAVVTYGQDGMAQIVRRDGAATSPTSLYYK